MTQSEEAPKGPAAAVAPAPPLGEIAAADTRLVPLRDVRIAVTMAGGVSLAIYENGVAQELYRMVHGIGLYGVLKRLTNSHATVDVLSGASAGGINSLLLGAALANRTDFRPVRDTWVNIADIDALAQSPNKQNLSALMKGEEYFLPRISTLVTSLLGKGRPAALPPGIPSIFTPDTPYAGDLDLFITGTYYEGQQRTFFDSAGQPMFTFEYAGVFHLKHRERRRQSHLNPKMPDPEDGASANDPDRAARITRRISRIARTTSSLPAVFEPSPVSPEDMAGIIPLPPGGVSYMFDGGFLNNRPLKLVLDEIYRRPADRDVLRRVMLIEPKPETAAGGPAKAIEPNALQALWFYKDVPSRQNLIASFQTLADHNHGVDRLGEALATARRVIASGCRPTVAQHNLWVRIRLRQQRAQLMDLWKDCLGLSGFGGILSDADGPSVLAHERQMRAVSDTLSLVRARLSPLMEAACRDFLPETVPCDPVPDGAEPAAQEGGAPAPGSLDVVQPFSLDNVDAGRLIRSTMRAIDDIYRALADIGPLPTAARDRNAMAHHADSYQIEARKTATDYLKRAAYTVGRLYRLRDLVEIVYENIALVVQTVAASPTYREAAEAVNNETGPGATPPSDTAVVRLWNVLALAVRLLLRKVDDNRLLDALGEETVTTPPDESETRRAEEAADGIHRELSARSDSICTALRQGATALEALAPAAPDGGVLLLEQIEDALVSLVEQAAAEIQTAAGLVKAQGLRGLRALTSAGAEAGLRAGPAHQTPGVDAPAFAWAWNGDGPKSANAVRAALRDLDIYLYPTEQTAGLTSRDPVDIIQVSPRIRLGLSDRDEADKLAGDILLNLGAFMKRSWRVNDVMWGQLDGSGALAETLLDRGRLEVIVQSDPAAIGEFLEIVDAYVDHGEVYAGDGSRKAVGPDDIGANLSAWYAGVREGVRAWLERAAAHEAAPEDDAAFTELRRILLLRHHLDIIRAEVPAAVAAEISDHARWLGRGDANPEPGRAAMGKETPFGLARRVTARTFRELFEPPTTTAVVESAQLAIQNWTTGAVMKRMTVADLEAYFQADYRVGTEDIGAAIPPVVNLRRLEHMLLLSVQIASNIAQTGADGPNRLMASLAGTLNAFLLRPLARILGILYELLWALGEGPRIVVAVHAGAWTTIIACALVLGFTGGKHRGWVWLILAATLMFEALISALRGRLRFESAISMVAGAALIALWARSSGAAGTQFTINLNPAWPVWVLVLGGAFILAGLLSAFVSKRE